MSNQPKSLNKDKLNCWRTKGENGIIKDVPISNLNNVHLSKAFFRSITNINNLVHNKQQLEKEIDILTKKLNHLSKHIQNCTINALNLQEEILKRNSNISSANSDNEQPVVRYDYDKNKISKFHPEVQEIFFEKEYNQLTKEKLQNKHSTTVTFTPTTAKPLLA